MDIDNYIRNLSTEELLDVLTSDQKQAIYDAVNYDLKKEDALSLLEDREDIPNGLKDNIASAVAEMWKAGDYDCNLSYWDNMDKFINRCCQKFPINFKEDKEIYKNFYFIFDSDSPYPYGLNDYVIVIAKNEYDAQMAFKAIYFNRPDSDSLNYAFGYTEKEWKTVYCRDSLPVETIIATDELVAIGREASIAADNEQDTDYEY